MDCASVCLEQAGHRFLASLKEVDWLNELRLVSTATLLTAIMLAFHPSFFRSFFRFFQSLNSYPPKNNNIRIIPILYISPYCYYHSDFLGLPAYIHSKLHPSNPNARRAIVCGPTPPPPPPPLPRNRTTPPRIEYTRHTLHIHAYPSKGGLITLSPATFLDLDFLGLDPLNPPRKRLANQDAEDAFCRRLLLLGAKWWDSAERCRFVTALQEEEGWGDAAAEVEVGAQPGPTARERCWISVAWPASGGIWVSEFEAGTQGEGVPEDVVLVRLARSMDERAGILKERFGARFYADVGEYEGAGFLKGWEEEKTTGEVGELEPCVPVEEGDGGGVSGSGSDSWVVLLDDE
jgi:hypothetical protein